VPGPELLVAVDAVGVVLFAEAAIDKTVTAPLVKASAFKNVPSLEFSRLLRSSLVKCVASKARAYPSEAPSGCSSSLIYKY
jgi:hypothetical protein